METQDRPQGRRNGAPPSGDLNPHAPDGERGEGNPREPAPDPRREGDVLNPDNRRPEYQPEIPANPGGTGRGHEADPPRPRKQHEDVPPYARSRSKDRRSGSR
jgi:hypothetical protein